uniref:Uncharacterized protein n=1 Tax=Tetranychus urticae TaxID=32264 RepID=T1KLK8_TETUR
MIPMKFIFTYHLIQFLSSYFLVTLAAANFHDVLSLNNVRIRLCFRSWFSDRRPCLVHALVF